LKWEKESRENVVKKGIEKKEVKKGIEKKEV
jgi:hypothetical protein